MAYKEGYFTSNFYYQHKGVVDLFAGPDGIKHITDGEEAYNNHTAGYHIRKAIKHFLRGPFSKDKDSGQLAIDHIILRLYMAKKVRGK